MIEAAKDRHADCAFIRPGPVDGMVLTREG
jgi:hypothetical protein